jgi:hypothetical protein
VVLNYAQVQLVILINTEYGISTYRSEVPLLWRLRCLAGAAVTVREAPLVSVGSECWDRDYRSCLLRTTCSLTGNCLWVNSSRGTCCHGARHSLILQKTINAIIDRIIFPPHLQQNICNGGGAAPPQTASSAQCDNLYSLLFILFIISGSAAQRGLWPPHSRGFVITQRRSTVGRTHLDE